MTAKRVTNVDVKEIKEIQIACKCGSSLTLPVPPEQPLPDEYLCLGCGKPFWIQGSPVLQVINNLIVTMGAWSGLKQDRLTMSFVLTEKTLEDKK